MVRLRACGFIIVVREQRGRSPGAILKNVFRSSSVFGAPVKVFSCIFEALIDRAKAAGIQMSETRRGATSYHCTLGATPCIKICGQTEPFQTAAAIFNTSYPEV